MQATAPGPTDAAPDFLPPSAPASVARTAIMTERPHGRAVLMGGVSMLGGEDFELPSPWITCDLVTPKRQRMYPREAVAGMVGLVGSGMLDLGQFAVTESALHDASEAVAHAAADAGPFRLAVMKP